MRTRVALGLVVALVAALVATLEARGVARDLATPRDRHGAPYAGSQECARCHPSHEASWRRTFHRTMTAEASAASVVAPFDGRAIDYLGLHVVMDRAGGAQGAYRMTFTDAHGRFVRRATVARTVGSHRFQQFLARTDDLFVRLPVAWSVEDQRFVPMNGAFLTGDPPPRTALSDTLTDFDRHVTRWNDNCVFCHNVAPNPGRDADGRFHTTTAELGVACEACHGPAADHVRANTDPFRRWALGRGAAPDPTITSPRRLSPERSADVCGRCHGQRITPNVGAFLAHGDPFVAGDDLSRWSRPLRQDTPLHGDATAFEARFWRDGTPRLTAYEYQGLLLSPCTEGGLTCTTCHGMHEGDPEDSCARAPPATARAPAATARSPTTPRSRGTAGTTRTARARAARAATCRTSSTASSARASRTASSRRTRRALSCSVARTRARSATPTRPARGPRARRRASGRRAPRRPSRRCRTTRWTSRKGCARSSAETQSCAPSPQTRSGTRTRRSTPRVALRASPRCSARWSTTAIRRCAASRGARRSRSRRTKRRSATTSPPTTSRRGPPSSHARARRSTPASPTSGSSRASSHARARATSRNRRMSAPREPLRSARFGWAALLAWALTGLALETAHGLKLAAYLDDALVRLLLTLAHAHGAGLALVVLAHGAAGAPHHPDDASARRAGLLLRAAALLVPLGFALGAIGHGESDPSPLVLLVPLGALALVAGLALDLRAAVRRKPE